MKFITYSLHVSYLLLCCLQFSHAQFAVTSLGQNITVDFDSTTPGVCDGPIRGTGFTADPFAGSGMIDSDIISFTGLVDNPSMEFGGTAVTGDAARGVATNPANGGGFYAFTPNGGTGRAFGFLPSTTHFNPGTITFKFTNQTGFAINEFSFGVDVYIRGASDRSTNFNFGISTDGTNFVNASPDGFNTPQAAFPFFINWVGPGFDDQLSINQDVCLPNPINNNSSVFIRFSIVDVGVGNDQEGDAIAFDNISFTAPERAYCPAANVTDLTISRSADGTSATLNWTNPSPCFDEVVVVARANDEVTANVTGDNLDGTRLGMFTPDNVNANWSARGTNNEVFSFTQGLLGTASEDFFVYKGTDASATVTGLTADIDYNFRVLAVSSGCDWATGVDDRSSINALATQLMHFDVRTAQQQVNLRWKAIHDAAHLATIVERSTDGVHFETLETLWTTGDSGMQTYELTDNRPAAGQNYYRLRLLDEDGSSFYSPVRVVYHDAIAAIQLTPMIANNQLVVHHIPHATALNYVLYHYNGNVVQRGRLQSTVQLPDMTAGQYILMIEHTVAIPFSWQ